MSTCSILSVGEGDISLSFDPANPAERIRAARVVRDMIRRGYALLVEVERDGKKAYERALDFDEERCEYIIADYDPLAAAPEPFVKHTGLDEGVPIHEEAETQKTKRGRPKKARLEASKTKAVAVSRSAGG